MQAGIHCEIIMIGEFAIHMQHLDGLCAAMFMIARTADVEGLITKNSSPMVEVFLVLPVSNDFGSPTQAVCPDARLFEKNVVKCACASPDHESVPES
jgi:hypothetical protein